MTKATEAFRTISEVAADLEVPKHVLRFWEAKFPQIRPMKRGGGRRYYRPEDLELLRGIRHLLHAEGYTIKGVQKILREHGIDQVKAFAGTAAKLQSERRALQPSGVAAEPVEASKKPASGSAPRASQTTQHAQRAEAQAHDIIGSLITELELCRRLLAAVPAESAERPVEVQRRRSAS